MKRGRKSAASLAIVTPFPGVRPVAPEDFDTPRRAIWDAIVARMPADWFTVENLPLLRQYVSHVASAETLDTYVASFKPEWLATDDGLRRYERLMSMREREDRALVSLARSMRLTHQSRYKAEKAATKVGGVGMMAKPWEKRA